MTRKRARLDRLAAEQAARNAERQPFLDPELRRWAEEHSVYLAPDHELRELYRTHRFHQPTDEEVRKWAAESGVDLDDDATP